MTDRFSPADIWNGHVKGLKHRDYSQERPTGTADRAARVILYLVPLAAGAAAYWFNLRLAGPGGLIEIAGIFVGAFLVGFTQVAAWRERYTARLREAGELEVHQRDSLDESAAHLLMAIYATMVLIVVLVVGSNFTNEQDELVGLSAALTVAIGSYILLLLTLVLPKLYTAYIEVNQVDDELSGASR